MVTVAALASASAVAAPNRPLESGQYRNLFSELLGKSDAEIAAKVDGAWRQLFQGDENSQRLFYPIDDGSAAYVPDIANNDVRTEGLSYAMMICVQTDHQQEFNQLWKFAKRFMYHDAGPFRGYFSWHTAFNGRPLSFGPAPDGEEWFTMALFFASHRWGDGEGVFNYSAEAQGLLRTMLHKHEEPGRGPIGDMFDREAQQVNFVPTNWGAHITDPSYHLPAFYELWARWATDPADCAFLAGVAKTSRELFRKAAHPKTGLMPDYANFDGTPYKAPWGHHENFLYDAWRTLSNPALDYAWWGADDWTVGQSNRVLTFLAAQGPNIPDRYQLDGTPVSTAVNTPGLIAMAATAGLAADPAIARSFVQRLWDQPVPTGYDRYYDGLLTMLALLECSGNFRIYAPPAGH
jgi:oligosaccharide reducing-end xylanase